MTYDLRTVALADIRPDDTYRISTEKQDGLKTSISRVGLIHPPLLLLAENAMTVIAGFRRISACRALGWTHTPARVATEDAMPVFERCLAAVADNCVSRELDIVESASAVRLLHEGIGDAEAVARALSILQMPTSSRWIERQLRVAALPGFIQEAMLAGVIGTAMGRTLGRLNKEDAEVLCCVFTDFKLNLNRQRELLSHCEDISRRDDIGIRDVLRIAVSEAEKQSTASDIASRSKTLRENLHRTRYPRLSSDEARFDRRRKSMAMGEGMQLTAPPYFEGGIYRLLVSFSSVEEFQKRIDVMRRVVDGPHLKKILSRDPE